MAKKDKHSELEAQKKNLNKADVVVICATDIEYKGLKRHLHPDGEAAWTNKFTEDRERWWVADFSTSEQSRSIRVVLRKTDHMGMAAAATLCTQAIDALRPKYAAMLGICAGNDEEDVKIGDVLISSAIFDYGAGKWTQQSGRVEFKLRQEQCKMQRPLINQIQDSDYFRGFGKSVRDAWSDFTNGKQEFVAPEIRIGKTTSGAAVINSEKYWDAIVNFYTGEKIIGLEMEAYGFAYAADASCRLRYIPRWIVAKSACDFGKDKKSGAQDFAVYTSARFFRDFLTHIVGPDILDNSDV